MKIIYREHLKRRLKERKIPSSYPRRVYLNSTQRFFDTGTNHHIAIAKLEYAGKLKNLAVSYDIIGSQIELITIHPISDQEILNKVKIGRWTRDEKN